MSLTAPQLLASVAGELPPDETIVVLEQVAPAGVAQATRPFRRTNDVGEQHGGKPSAASDGATATRQERLRLIRYCVAVGEPMKMVGPRELDISSPLDPGSDEPPLCRWHQLVFRAMHDQRRGNDR
jgi:hypothetical protein